MDHSPQIGLTVQRAATSVRRESHSFKRKGMTNRDLTVGASRGLRIGRKSDQQSLFLPIPCHASKNAKGNCQTISSALNLSEDLDELSLLLQLIRPSNSVIASHPFSKKR
jgi:hypothetical protein